MVSWAHFTLVACGRVEICQEKRTTRHAIYRRALGTLWTVVLSDVSSLVIMLILARWVIKESTRVRSFTYVDSIIFRFLFCFICRFLQYTLGYVSVSLA